MTCFRLWLTLSKLLVVNYIKSPPLQSRFVENLCEEAGALRKHLLIHTKVGWLSRGKVLSWLFSLESEPMLFLMDSKLKFPVFSVMKYV